MSAYTIRGKDAVIRQTRTRTIVLAAVVALSTVALASSATAQSKKKVDEQLDLLEQRLVELGDKDEWGAAEEDRQMARETLEKARELLAQGTVEKADWLAARVADRVELVQALIDVRRIRAMAEQQEKKYEKHKEETIPELEAEIETLKKRQRELKEKLDELK